MYTFLLVLVTLVWGSTFFIIKDTVSSVNEYILVFGRTLLAALFMLAVLLVKNRKSLLDKKAITYGVVLGGLLAITYISQTIGLKYTSSGHSAFITGSAVVIVPILLFLFFKKKIVKKTNISIVIVFSGLYLLTYGSSGQINIGDLITFITALACAGHIVLAGKFVKKADVLSMITYQFITASVLSLVSFLLSGTGFTQPGTTELSAICYLGFIGTLFCYFISVWAQKYVSSIKVALTFSLEPVFAALFGYFFLSELLNFKEITGAILILFGVILDTVLKDKTAFAPHMLNKRIVDTTHNPRIQQEKTSLDYP